jgi:hypothetical protein
VEDIFATAIFKFSELDLSSVVQQKNCIYRRFLKRRPSFRLPNTYEVDLNDKKKLGKQLRSIFTTKADQQSGAAAIFIIEAVLMYLKPENVAPVLKTCIKEAKRSGRRSFSVCFADRFPQTVANDDDPHLERAQVEAFLRRNGLRIIRYEHKRGRVRHMGIACQQ